MKKLCLCLAFACSFNVTASSDELTRKQNSGTAKTMMAQFLSLLAGIALIISAKDKEQRLQAAANIISGLATVAQIVAGNASSDDDTDNGPDPKRIKHAYEILLEQQEFADLIQKNKAELRALLTKILAAYQEEEQYHQVCDA